MSGIVILITQNNVLYSYYYIMNTEKTMSNLKETGTVKKIKTNKNVIPSLVRNISTIQSAYRFDDSEMGKIAWLTSQAYYHKRKWQTQFSIVETMKIANYFNVDLTMLVSWVVKAESEVKLVVGVEA